LRVYALQYRAGLLSILKDLLIYDIEKLCFKIIFEK